MTAYTITIGTGSTVATLSPVPRVSWRDVERIHRHDTAPSTLGARVVEITLEGCRVESTSPTAVITALGVFLAAYLNVRVMPAFVQIKDSFAEVVDEIGEINSANGWEEVQITGFSLAGDVVGQLLAGAEFDLTIQGRKVYADSNGVWFFAQERTVEYNEAGLQRRTLTTDIRLSEATANTIAGLASSMREARPVGWRRVAPSNGTSGVAIRYANYPKTTWGIVTSIVEEIAAGYVLPVGAGAGTVIETVQRDRELGIDRYLISAEIAGTSDPLGWVEAQAEGGELVTKEHDRHHGTARGVWERRVTVAGQTQQKGTVTRIETRLQLGGGGQAVEATTMSGGAAPEIRHGGYVAYRLTEQVQVWALAPADLAQIPPPPAFSSPWVLDGPGSDWQLPRVEDRGGTTAHHVWSTTLVRHYVWSGADKPTADTDFAAAIMERGRG